MTGALQRMFWVFALAVLALGAPFAAADELRALSRLDLARSSMVETPDGKVNLTLGLSQPIPYRAYLLDAPTASGDGVFGA